MKFYFFGISFAQLGTQSVEEHWRGLGDIAWRVWWFFKCLEEKIMRRREIISIETVSGPIFFYFSFFLNIVFVFFHCFWLGNLYGHQKFFVFIGFKHCFCFFHYFWFGNLGLEWGLWNFPNVIFYFFFGWVWILEWGFLKCM